MKRASVVVVLVLLACPRTAPADSIEQIGNVGAVALPVAGGLAAAFQKDGKGALQLTEAYATTMAVVYILKPLVNEKRPDGGSQSFPSGHAASAFAGAAFLQMRYGWAYGAPAYALATFVAYSRVEAKRHWTRDVITGGAIGIASNLIFTRRYQKLALQPVPQARGAALTIQIRW